MKKLNPIGYSKSSVGTGFGVFIIVFGIVLMAIIVKNGASAADAKYLMIGAAVLAVLFGLIDFTSNLKNSKKISYMNDMLECPSVKGEIREIKKSPYFLGKIHENLNDKNQRYNHYAYQIIAAFYDNESKNEKLIKSEPYARDPRVFISGNTVRIHYSSDGNYWIDPDNIVDDNVQSGYDISRDIRIKRFVERHGALVTLITMAFSVLVLVVAYFIITNIFG